MNSGSICSDELASQAVGEKHYLKTAELRGALIAWAEALSAAQSLPLAFDDDPDVSGLLKLLNFRLDEEGLDLPSRLDQLFRLQAGLLGTDIVVLLFPHQQFSDEELEQVYRAAHYRKLFLLCMETRVPARKLEGESWFIIDKDHCTVYNQDEQEFL